MEVFHFEYNSKGLFLKLGIMPFSVRKCTKSKCNRLHCSVRLVVCQHHVQMHHIPTPTQASNQNVPTLETTQGALLRLQMPSFHKQSTSRVLPFSTGLTQLPYLARIKNSMLSTTSTLTHSWDLVHLAQLEPFLPLGAGLKGH